MASNLKVDIVKPTATNGSLSLKGDSGGSATTNGISVDSSGDTSITGTTTIATADINGGTIDGTTIGASSAAAGTFTSVDATSASLDGAVTINDSGADVDFRVEGSGQANALFVDGTNGNVGIGTNLPSSRQHVKGTWVDGKGILQVDADSGTDYSGLTFQNDGTIGTYFYDDNSNNLTFLGSTAGKSLVFATNTSGISNERMRIDNSGNVLIGTATAGLSNGISTSIEASGVNNSRIYVNHSSSGSSNGSLFMGFGYGGSGIGSITQASTSSVAYNTSSDYRLKEDVQPMSGSIDRLKALKPVNFAWKSDGSRVDGFLAHEAQEVVPEAVTGEKDAMRMEEYEVTPAVLDEDGNVINEAVMGEREVPDYQGIDQAKLVPLLTAALQEAVAKIESLEARIATLEATPA